MKAGRGGKVITDTSNGLRWVGVAGVRTFWRRVPLLRTFWRRVPFLGRTGKSPLQPWVFFSKTLTRDHQKSKVIRFLPARGFGQDTRRSLLRKEVSWQQGSFAQVLSRSLLRDGSDRLPSLVIFFMDTFPHRALVTPVNYYFAATKDSRKSEHVWFLAIACSRRQISQQPLPHLPALPHSLPR